MSQEYLSTGSNFDEIQLGRFSEHKIAYNVVLLTPQNTRPSVIQIQKWSDRSELKINHSINTSGKQAQLFVRTQS